MKKLTLQLKVFKKNSILWEKFLSKNTLKPFPLNFDCSLEEKLLYAKDEQLEN
ncbi:hypothetical protein G3Z78_002006, partial [Campylobacter coli]|nr:hypothetical protein [Campylobacter coli]EEA8343183.1 hypothetical protein [Campylobacter coli]EHN0385572.1 hypothetical protein [Campylobacter coli]EHO0537235.1 hypothetical protein [Campylobacter coli]